MIRLSSKLKDTQSPLEDHLLEVKPIEGGFEAEFIYPSYEETPFLEINLMSVRASDGIRVWYSFERNGWVVEQASTFSWEEWETKFDMDWQEVAFVESWVREKREDDTDVVL